MIIPASTYRIQLNHEFTFAELKNQIDYLNSLGISTIYASPIAMAVPQSLHGYDVTDSNTVNLEIGTIKELKGLADNLHSLKMSWLQDIVPNHMAYSVRNGKLMDVLERGSKSEYYNYFDIQWDHPSPWLKHKVMLPVLTEPMDHAIKDISFEFGPNGIDVKYKSLSYPVALDTFDLWNQWEIAKPVADDLAALLRLAGNVIDRQKWLQQKGSWLRDMADDPKKNQHIKEFLAVINRSEQLLRPSIECQKFRLMQWQDAGKTINYRRFFMINELIGLRMENEATFLEYHQLYQKMFAENLLQGLRIDHIDGLYDPRGYCNQLRRLFGPECYIVAEKILAEDEILPESWGLQGLSGYEFLGDVNRLFTNDDGSRKLLHYYRQIIPDQAEYRRQVRENKSLILRRYMGGEWDNLTDILKNLYSGERFTREDLKRALGELLVSLPVYRLYPETLPLCGRDAQLMRLAFTEASSNAPSDKDTLEYLSSLFLQDNTDTNISALFLLKRVMQFTGPVTAKGIEDTTFYSYNPLISHDEVGESPTQMSEYAAQFHKKMIMRQKHFPLSLNATSTHDTKRGEDARLRINVLTELPDQWMQLSARWISENQPEKKLTINDQYFIYQTIIGGYPADRNISAEWIGRLKEYLQKAVREGKINSDWAEPNTEYETSCEEFIDGLFDENNPFRRQLKEFMQTIDSSAMTYSLAAVLLKIACPGIPDIYQGCELFNHSFVDPDNRRKVDFDVRRQFLKTLVVCQKKSTPDFFRFLRESRSSGIEKMFVTTKALNFRKIYSSVFTDGEYRPLQFSSATDALAFARIRDGFWIVVVVPTSLTRRSSNTAHGSREIDDARVLFPKEKIFQLTNEFTGEVHVTDSLTIANLFKLFPVALLSGYEK